MRPLYLLSTAFVASHPADAARVLEELEPDERGRFLSRCDPAAVGAVLREMVPYDAAHSLEAMPVDAAARVLAGLPADEAAALLRMTAGPRGDELLAALDPATTVAIGFLLRYPEGSAGSLMDARVPAVAGTVTVGGAVERIRRDPRGLVYYVYVVDDEGRLDGVLSIRELLAADPTVPVATVARRPVARLNPRSSAATIVAHPKWRDVHALPVVSDDGRLVGVLRYATLRRLEGEVAADRGRLHPGFLLLGLGRLYWISLGQLVALAGALVVAAARRRAPV
jgi:magnesium transporter